MFYLALALASVPLLLALLVPLKFTLMIISHKETSIVFKIYICILMLLTTIMGGDLYVKYFANDVLNFILFLFSGI